MISVVACQLLTDDLLHRPSTNKERKRNVENVGKCREKIRKKDSLLLIHSYNGVVTRGSFAYEKIDSHSYGGGLLERRQCSV